MIFSFQNASFRDGETGLYNQAYFMEILNREWHRLIRDKSSLSLLLLNPHINISDSMDKACFIEIAQLLKASTYRSSDIICRFNDSYFAIGLFDLNEAGTTTIVQRIQDTIETQIKLKSLSVNLTVGGINVLPSNEILIEDIFKYTVDTLQEAESQGCNAYSIHEVH